MDGGEKKNTTGGEGEGRGRGEQKREKVTACCMFLSLWEGKTRAVDAMEEYRGTHRLR